MAYTLAFKDRFFRDADSRIESDTSNSVVFASIPDTVPTKVLHEWTGKEFTKLYSAVFMGAKLMFPEESEEIIWTLVRAIHQPLSFDEEGDCFTFPMSAPFVVFTPQNPYTQPDFTPEDYIEPPFFVNSEFEYPEEFGYLASDVFLRPSAINIDPIDLLTFNLPQIKISVVGTGTINLGLLAVTLGGYAIVKVGSPPNIFDIISEGLIEGVKIIDLNIDSLSVPPETDITQLEEIPVVADTGVQTDIYVVFTPALDDSIVPIRNGGGLRNIELCGFEEVVMIDCEAVEACIETSPTVIEIINNITEIENQVTDINNTIIEIENNITIIDDDGQGNTGVNPPSYNLPATSGDNYSSAACNAAYFMADKVLEFMAEFWEDASTLDLQEWALKILGLGGFRMEAFFEFASYVFAIGEPTLPEDALDYRDNLAEAFFCGNLTRQEAANNIASDAGVPEPVKSALYYAVNFITQDKLNQWAYVADFDTVVNDCSEMCSWVVVWDFTGLYEPLEGETVYVGNNWSVYNGEFVEGTGYGGLLDTWGIEHSLPKDCRIAQMQVNHNKNVPCASVGERVTWRGTSGTDAEDFSFEGTIISNAPTTASWDLHSAEINDMNIQHNHFLCDEQYGSQIHWVKMTGTGAKPAQ